MSDRTVRVRLEAITSSYETRMRSAGLATQQLTATTNSLRGGLIEGAAAVTGLNQGLELVTRFVGPAVQAFNDLRVAGTELVATQGAVRVIFGESGNEMAAFAREAEGLGLSQVNASRYAALLGGQLQALGFSASESAERAQDLIRHAADLSVGFGTTGEAVNGLSALLRGEYDTIERFAVGVKQSDIDARVAAKGLDHLTGEALKQEQALAALELMYGQTSDRVGLWGSESNTAAREAADLQATLDNLQAEFGAKLLPVIIDVTSALNTGLEVARIYGETLARIPDLVPDLPSFPTLALPPFLRGIMPDVSIQHDEEAEASLNDIASAGVVGEAVMNGLAKATDSVANAIGRMASESKTEAESLEALFDPFMAYEDVLGRVDDAHEAVADSQRALDDAQRAAVDAARDVADAQRDVAAAMAETFDAAAAAEEGVQKLADAQRAAVDPVFGLMEALEKQAEAARGPRTIVDETGKTARLDVGATPVEAAQAAAAVDAAAIQLVGAVRAGQVSPERLRDTFQQWLEQGRLTESMAQRLTASLGDVFGAAEALQGANVDQAIAAEIAADNAEFQAEKAEKVRDAQDRLTDALDRSEDAQRRAADAAENLRDRHDDALQTAIDLDLALIGLNDALEANPALFDQAIRKLDEWVARGVLTAGQAQQIRDRIREAVLAAQDFDGDYQARLSVDATAVFSTIAALSGAMTSSVGAALGGLAGVASLSPPPRALGGPTNPYASYLVGEEGPEVLTMGGSGGYVHPLAGGGDQWGDWTGSSLGRGATTINNYYFGDSTVDVDNTVNVGAARSVGSARDIVRELETSGAGGEG